MQLKEKKTWRSKPPKEYSESWAAFDETDMRTTPKDPTNTATKKEILREPREMTDAKSNAREQNIPQFEMKNIKGRRDCLERKWQNGEKAPKPKQMTYTDKGIGIVDKDDSIGKFESKEKTQNWTRKSWK